MDLKQFGLNLAVAFLGGFLVGLERQIQQRTAGLRTNTLVAVGAALFLSVADAYTAADGAVRIAAQVVSGIGFLGAGVIMREGLNVRGMNTAATLWCSAAVGLLAGSSQHWAALIGAGAILAVHLTLRPLANRIGRGSSYISELETLYEICVVCDQTYLDEVRNLFVQTIEAKDNMTIQGVSTEDGRHDGRTTLLIDIYSTERNDNFLNTLVGPLSLKPHVTAISWKRKP
ncbi:MAG: MgtC/SapB family protein [Planctomycetes bacterium]|nr:MgtC/SapB family protein [Planctomycetota bacterium]